MLTELSIFTRQPKGTYFYTTFSYQRFIRSIMEPRLYSSATTTPTAAYNHHSPYHHAIPSLYSSAYDASWTSLTSPYGFYTSRYRNFVSSPFDSRIICQSNNSCQEEETSEKGKPLGHLYDTPFFIIIKLFNDNLLKT